MFPSVATVALVLSLEAIGVSGGGVVEALQTLSISEHTPV